MLSNNQIQLFCTGAANMNPQGSSTLLGSTTSSSTSSSTSSLASFQTLKSLQTRNSTNNLTSTRTSAEFRPQTNSNQSSNPVQIQNYITWINSHLKKRPGVRLVENLHSDLSNGVSLIHLIEVICKF